MSRKIHVSSKDTCIFEKSDFRHAASTAASSVAAQTQMSPASRLHWSRLSGGSSRPIAGSSSSPNSRAALQSRRTRPAPLLRELSENSEVEPMDPVRLGAHFRSPCNLGSSRPAGDLVAAAMDLPSSSLDLRIRLRHYRMLRFIAALARPPKCSLADWRKPARRRRREVASTFLALRTAPESISYVHNYG